MAPKITGAVAAQPTNDEAAVKPFTGVSISGSTAFNSEYVTVALLNQSGIPTDLNGTLSLPGYLLLQWSPERFKSFRED